MRGTEFFYWLAGFIDGEGCFNLRRTATGIYPDLAVELRADDAEILYEIRQQTGAGVITYRDRPRGERQVCWRITNLPDALRMVEILDGHPLRAKKRRDYEIWREAVLLKHSLGRRHGVDRGRLDDLKAALEDARLFDGVIRLAG